jgi:integrase/recombinase XerD
MRWELYPRVFECELAKAWLSIQHNLRLAPNTIEAYGRSLEDYLAFCEREGIEPKSAGQRPTRPLGGRPLFKAQPAR